MLKNVAFVLALTVLVSFALALESGPSNTVGFVKITCTQSYDNAFGLPFEFWDVVGGVPSHGTPSGMPSDIVGPGQLTGGAHPGVADRLIEQGGVGAYAWKSLAGVWSGSLETGGGMTAGKAFWARNMQLVDQDMVLAGEVDTSTFGPIAIAALYDNALSFRDARLVNRGNLNLIGSGFTGGAHPGVSDRMIEQGGVGAYCWLNLASVWQGSLIDVVPGNAYWIREMQGATWNYNYGPGSVAPPPERPGNDDGKINRITRPTRRSRSLR